MKGGGPSGASAVVTINDSGSAGVGDLGRQTTAPTIDIQLNDDGAAPHETLKDRRLFDRRACSRRG